MRRIILALSIWATALVSSPSVAQNICSFVGPDGVRVSCSAVNPLPVTGGGGGGGGDASAANQTTQITAANLTNTTLGAVTASPTANTIGDRLKTINTTLGSPFQAGGSIGNITFASTQSGTWDVRNISGTVSLPTGAATSANQISLAAQFPSTLGAKTGALSLSVVPNSDTAFTITDGSGVANSITIDNATASNLNAQVVGPIARGVTPSGNPLLNGCHGKATAPTAVAADQVVDQWCGLSGNGVTALSDISGTLVMTTANGADGLTNNGTFYEFRVRPENWNGSTWDRSKSITGSAGDGVGVGAVAIAPQSSANGAIAGVVSAAVEGSHVLKASAGNLYRVSITTGGTAGYLMVFNATTAPADGAVTPTMCRVIAANSTLSVTVDGMPVRFSTGITAVFSSTGCFTKTISATAFIEGYVQ